MVGTNCSCTGCLMRPGDLAIFRHGDDVLYVYLVLEISLGRILTLMGSGQVMFHYDLDWHRNTSLTRIPWEIAENLPENSMGENPKGPVVLSPEF